MNATNEIEVGTVVLVVEHSGGEPKRGNVDRLTKKWFYVRTADKEFGPFKQELYRPWHAKDDPAYFEKATRPLGPKAYFPDAEGFLNTKAAEHKAHCEAVAAEREADRLAEKARKEAELAEVKEAMGGFYGGHAERLPDGSRLYIIDLPIKPGYEERKGSFDKLIVRCKDKTEHDWRTTSEGGMIEIKVVEAATTWINAHTGSFSSCSTCSYRTGGDDAAIWDACRRRYHDSW